MTTDISKVSRWSIIADALQTDLVSLIGVGSGLAWTIESDHFFIQKVPRLPSTGYDRATLIMSPVDETNNIATIASNDIGYGYGIIILRPTNQEERIGLGTGFGDLDRLNLWRETVRRAYTAAGRLTAAGVHEVTFEPKAKLDIAAFRKLYDLTAFTIRARRREQGT